MAEVQSILLESSSVAATVLQEEKAEEERTEEERANEEGVEVEIA